MRTPLDIHFVIVAAIGIAGLIVAIYDVNYFGFGSMRGIGLAFAFLSPYAFMGVWTLRTQYIENSKNEEAQKKNTLLHWVDVQSEELRK